MDDALFSARSKLDWAHAHAATLDRDLREYAERKPFSQEWKRNADATKHWLELGISEEPPLLRWSLIFGDCIQNYRAALDHTIVGLVAAVTGKEIPADVVRRLAFPISSSPKKFAQAAKKDRKIGALGDEPAICSGIERWQPYNRPHETHGSILGLLRDLNNVDKHQIVRAAVYGVQLAEVRFDDHPDPQALLPAYDTSAPLVDGTVLIRVNYAYSAPDVKLEGEFEIFPAFVHETAPNGMDHTQIDWLTKHIGEEVTECIEALAGLLV